MVKQNEQGRLIAAAANATLLPIGCRRMGQSRCWVSDQRYWIIVIEFQPSGWERGSYLNVGAMWLWRVRKGPLFHAGYRVGDFIPFADPERFRPLIVEMAERAAREVLNVREKFKSLTLIHRYLIQHLCDGPSLYYAAVSAGLSGDPCTARRLFAKFEVWSNFPHRQTKLPSETTSLTELLEHPVQYRSAVQAIIDQCRALNGLPPDPNCLEILRPRHGRL